MVFTFVFRVYNCKFNCLKEWGKERSIKTYSIFTNRNADKFKPNVVKLIKNLGQEKHTETIIEQIFAQRSRWQYNYDNLECFCNCWFEILDICGHDREIIVVKNVEVFLTRIIMSFNPPCEDEEGLIFTCDDDNVEFDSESDEDVGCN